MLASRSATAAKASSKIIEKRCGASVPAITSFIVCALEMMFSLFWLCTTRRRAARELSERFVELSLERFPAIRRIETPLLHVSDYSDNLQWVPVTPQVDALADGVYVREILAGENLVNHDHRLRSHIILFGEEAASLERDAHGRQIGGFDLIDERHVHLARALRLRLPLDPEPEIVFALQGRGARRE